MSIIVVLAHGAFAESASWNGVIAHLQAAGATAIATPDPLRSVTTDAQNVRHAVESVGTPVLLVGHSYGEPQGRFAVVGGGCGRVNEARDTFCPDVAAVIRDRCTNPACRYAQARRSVDGRQPDG